MSNNFGKLKSTNEFIGFYLLPDFLAKRVSHTKKAFVFSKKQGDK